MSVPYAPTEEGVTEVPERIWTLIDFSGDCWEWIGHLYKHGYGQANVRGLDRFGHRLVWKALVGPIPDGFQLDHLCRNRACVNPDHLEPVTPRENIMRSPIHPMARAARQTHCKNGHPLSGDNLRISTQGYRICLACRRAGDHARYRSSLDARRRQKAARNADPNAPRCLVCDDASTEKGYCHKHYLRWRRHGDPLAGGNERRRARKEVAA